MNRSLGNQGAVAPVLLTIIALLLMAGPFVLHFGQKSHNQLSPVSERIPADTPFVPGEVYASTAVAIMEHELNSRTGWRPNDFILWGPLVTADNNSNRQLGIIQAMRESIRVLKDHLTKISSDQYDPNLVEADTAFRNDAEKFWLPSAEGKFRHGVALLKKYLKGLKTDPATSRPINRRNVELIRLFQAWTDLLGGAHAGLYDQEASIWQTDDFFYRAQGYAHVMYHLNDAVAREYTAEIEARPVLGQLFDEVAGALKSASTLKPLAVLNGGPSGLFANHRRNLEAYVNEARQKMYSIREELEK